MWYVVLFVSILLMVKGLPHSYDALRVVAFTNYRKNNLQSILDRAYSLNYWIHVQCQWRCPCAINCMALVRQSHSSPHDSWTLDGRWWWCADRLDRCRRSCHLEIIRWHSALVRSIICRANAINEDVIEMICMELLWCRRRTIECRLWWISAATTTRQHYVRKQTMMRMNVVD